VASDRVEAPASPGLPPPLASSRASAFHGRTEELATLEASWARAAHGRSRLVVLAGEPGVGKTRLAAEFAGRLAADGVTVLAGSCSPEPVGSYQPVREALRAYLAAAGPAELDAIPPARVAALARLLPELGPAPPRSGDPELARLALFDAIGAVLAGTGGDRPALLVIDDGQWADGSTTALVRHLLRTLAPGRLLLVMPIRPHEIGDDHPLAGALAELRSAELVDRLDLGGLDPAGIRALVADRAGHELDAALAGLVGELHRVTEGNPFFVIQLVRHLFDTGRLHVEDGRWRWTGDPHAVGPPAGLPVEVREVVGRRLANLTVEGRAALRAAAVLGTEFDIDRVGAVAGIDLDESRQLVEQAIGWRVVTAVPGSPNRFRFAHAMFREALYDEMSATRRQRLHQRAATHTGRAGGPGADATEIANHMLAAAAAVTPAELCAAVLAAGRRAFERTDYESAAELCTRALAALGGRIDDRDRVGLVAMRAEARLFTGDVASARDDVIASAGLAESVGEIATMADVLIAWCRSAPMLGPVRQVLALGERALAALGPDEEVRRARLTGALCHQLVYVEPLPAIERRALDAYRMARTVGDREAIGHAATAYRLTADHRPLSERRTDVLDAIAEVAAASDAHPGRLLLGQHRLIHAMEVGDRLGFDAALADYGELSDELQFPLGRATALRARAAVALAEGRLDDADAMGARAFDLTPYALVSYSSLLFVLYREVGRLAEVAPAVPEFIAQFPDIVTFHVVAMGIDHELGRTDAAADGLRRLAADRFRSVEGALAMRANVAVLSELAAAYDDPALAGPLLDLFAGWTGQNLSIEEYICLGASDRYLGQLETVLGRFDAAAARLERAIAFDEAFGSTLWAAYGRLALATTLGRRRRPGDADRAGRLLEEAAEVAERSGSGRLARLVDLVDADS
jgi:tetratricopeptide (TPR) repeat protein